MFAGLQDFSDLVKDKRAAQDLKALYGHVDNIDLWVGGLAEQHEDGSELGPTFSTLVSNCQSVYYFCSRSIVNIGHSTIREELMKNATRI